MKRWSVVVMIIGLMLSACQAAPTPTAEPTATDEPTTEPAPTSAPTFTPIPATQVPSATPVPAPTATLVPSDVWVTAANGLNLRASANVTATLVTTLKDKQHLVAMEKPVGPDAGGTTWQHVRADDGQAGFVSTAFLTTTNPAGPAKPATTPSAPTATVAAPSPAVTSTVPANVTGEVYVTAPDGLNLRAQANATSNVVVIVAYAQHLTALGAPIGPDAAGITWQGVRTDDGKTGYVAAQFVSTTKPAPTPTPTIVVTPTTPITPTATPTVTVPVTPAATAKDVWVIATGGLFLRAQPSATSGVVAALNYGQHLTALSAPAAPDAGGIAWQNVRTDVNQTGYAAAEFLSTTQPVTATPPITVTATPTTTTQSEPQNVSLAVSPGSNSAAVELFQRINALRAERGLNQLVWNDRLATAALRHNEDMAATGRISHTGSDGTLEQQRIAASGYTASASDEVIYASVNGLEPAWSFWSTHPIHVYVLTNARYTDVGVSAYTAGETTYFTADFGEP